MIARIVTAEQGSWKWQKAYRISTYRPHVTRDGRVILRSSRTTLGKYSWPQLRGSALVRYGVGSLHNARPDKVVIDDYGTLVGVWVADQFASA
jgi:hypothetical protein